MGRNKSMSKYLRLKKIGRKYKNGLILPKVASERTGNQNSKVTLSNLLGAI